MERWVTALQLLLVCVLCSNAAEEGKYLVAAPKVFSPGRPFTASVQILDSPASVHILLEIEFFSYPNSIYSIAGVEGDFLQGNIGTLTIMVPNSVMTGNGNYRLHVRGTGGLQIDTRQEVTKQDQVAHVFLQTDREIYKPGQRVTFQTFALQTLDLKPHSDTYDISLKTPTGFLVQRWTSLPSTVTVLTFDLDEHPPLGRWSITTSSAKVGTTNSYFTVEDYDKPVFTVEVLLPETMNTSETLEGTVQARYPHGVGVIGTAEITVSGPSYGYGGQTPETSLQMEGNVSFSFPDLFYSSAATVVTATVTEQETGEVVSGSSSINVYERDIKVQFTETTPAVFRPGLPFTAYVQITNNADQPLDIAPDSIFRTVYVYGTGHYTRPSPDSRYQVSAFTGSYPILASKLTLPDSGFFPVDLEIPNDVNRIDLVVTFQGTQRTLSLNSVTSSTQSYLQVYLVGTEPVLQRDLPVHAQFRAASNNPLTALNVEMISRGQVVTALQPTLTNQDTSGDVFTAQFEVELTWAMTPVTEIIVYYTRQSEIVADSLAFDVSGLLQNTVQLSVDSSRFTPGDSVTLHLSGLPNSIVGVTVQEQTGNNNGMTSEMMRKVFASGTLPSSSSHVIATSQQYALSSFAGAGLNVINGLPQQYFGRTNPVTQVSYTGHQNQNEMFPDTTFFAINSTGVNGETSFTFTLPDTVTTWIATAFAYDSNGNLGVVDTPVTIEAIRDVYTSLSGPDQAVSGEHVIIRADIHNSQPVDAQVTAVLKLTSNAMAVLTSLNGTQSLSSENQRQTVTVPALASVSVYFVVTSTAEKFDFAVNVEVDIISGSTRYTLNHQYQSVPHGAAQTFTMSDVTTAQGQITKAISPSLPREAAHEVYRVQISGDMDTVPLERAIARADITEEGTAADALLHLVLPVEMVKTHPEMVSSLRPSIERAYQRLLVFVNGNRVSMFAGSGLQDPWLTLVALNTLKYTQRYITVDQTLYSNMFNGILSGINFAVSNPPSALNPTALQSYYAMILKTNNDIVLQDYMRTTYLQRVNESLVFLTNAIQPALSDPLTLSCVLYASTFYGIDVTSALTSLLGLAHTNLANDEIFWVVPRNNTLQLYGDWQLGSTVPSSDDVTTAAYALLTLVRVNRATEAEKVARWLLKQRTWSGAFRTAEDSIAATEALASYYILVGGTPRANAVQVETQGLGQPVHHNIDQSPLHLELRSGETLNYTVTGHGTAFVQVEMLYTLTQSLGDTSFETVPVVLDENLNGFKLMVCSRWLEKSPSGFVVQEVDVPSGFLADTSDLNNQRGVLKVIRRSDTRITVYFNQVDVQSSCYSLNVHRQHPVAQIAPAYIITRSLREPANQHIVSYQPRRLAESTVCDVCEKCCV